MFQLGEAITTEQDWYFVIDGDEVVTDVGTNIVELCRHAKMDVGNVTLWNYRQQQDPDARPFATPLLESQTIRAMFRAVRGLAVGPKHYEYVTPDGRYLWGDSPQCVPAEDFTTVQVEHRNAERDLWRAKEAKDYYKQRDALNIEGLV